MKIVFWLFLAGVGAAILYVGMAQADQIAGIFGRVCQPNEITSCDSGRTPLDILRLCLFGAAVGVPAALGLMFTKAVPGPK